MNILSWMIFGMIIGAIATILDKKQQEGGALGAVLLGVVGAILGGLLANLLFGTPLGGFNPIALLTAIGGAIVVLFAGRLIKA